MPLVRQRPRHRAHPRCCSARLLMRCSCRGAPPRAQRARLRTASPAAVPPEDCSSPAAGPPEDCSCERCCRCCRLLNSGSQAQRRQEPPGAKSRCTRVCSTTVTAVRDFLYYYWQELEVATHVLSRSCCKICPPPPPSPLSPQNFISVHLFAPKNGGTLQCSVIH